MSAPAVTTQIILSEADLVKREGISSRTAKRWRSTGEGPHYVRIGMRRIGYRLSDVETWEAARTYPHRAAELAKSITTAHQVG